MLSKVALMDHDIELDFGIQGNVAEDIELDLGIQEMSLSRQRQTETEATT